MTNFGQTTFTTLVAGLFSLVALTRAGYFADLPENCDFKRLVGYKWPARRAVGRRGRGESIAGDFE
jgi:hypothetical protein